MEGAGKVSKMTPKEEWQGHTGEEWDKIAVSETAKASPDLKLAKDAKEKSEGVSPERGEAWFEAIRAKLDGDPKPLEKMTGKKHQWWK